jgi:hypothetical protein
MEKKTTIGLIEKITVLTNDHKERVVDAKIDTGASKSSIDLALASELNLGPIIKTKIVKSAHGVRIRPVLNVTIILHGKKMKAEFTIADRKHMAYKILIGQNILKNGFLIDPSLNKK